MSTAARPKAKPTPTLEEQARAKAIARIALARQFAATAPDRDDPGTEAADYRLAVSCLDDALGLMPADWPSRDKIRAERDGYEAARLEADTLAVDAWAKHRRDWARLNRQRRWTEEAAPGPDPAEPGPPPGKTAGRADRLEEAADRIGAGLSPCCGAPIDTSRVIKTGRHKNHGPRFCSECRRCCFMV